MRALYLLLIGICLGPSLMAQAPALEVRSHSVYHPRTQQLVEKYEYYYDNWSEKEVLHGRYTQWDAKGVLQSEAKYQHGLKHGLCIKYRQGTIQVVSKYDKGVLNGIQEVYTRSGNLKKRIRYQNGLKEGDTVAFNRAGEPTKTLSYHQGKIQPNK